MNNIKGGDNVTGSSSTLWDISIEEAEGFNLHEELKAASGIGRRRRSGVCPCPVNLFPLTCLWFGIISGDLEISLCCLNK